MISLTFRSFSYTDIPVLPKTHQKSFGFLLAGQRFYQIGELRGAELAARADAELKNALHKPDTGIVTAP